MSDLIIAVSRGDAAEVERLFRERASEELDGQVVRAMGMAATQGNTHVMKCLIKDGGANIDAVVTVDDPKYSALPLAAMYGHYPLVQWLIEEGALVPEDIWEMLRRNLQPLRDAAELSSFLGFMLLDSSFMRGSVTPFMVWGVDPTHPPPWGGG
jgi:hypothetical protein